MSRNYRKGIMKSYILGKETESLVSDSIEEINRLSLIRSAEAEMEEGPESSAAAEGNN